MRIIVTAGGTGGHINPALAIIEKLNEDDEVLYVGTNNRMEKDIVPSKGINYKALSIRPFQRKKIYKNFSAFYYYLKSLKEAKKIIKEFKPDAVIGFGGYITYPILKVANKMGVNTYIHEQNVIPGLANKVLDKKVNKVFVSLEDSKDYFKNKKIIFTGNPSAERAHYAKAKTKVDLGFTGNKKLIFIVMGSLGSMTVTEKLLSFLEKLSKTNYNYVIITGNNYRDLYKKDYHNIKYFSYLDSFPSYLKAADLIITRAGATTIAEISAIGLPSILIPSPFVTNNHQEKNARSLEKNNQALVILEEDLTFDLLIEKINSLLEDDEKYKMMKENLLKSAKIDSANRIIHEIKGDLNG